MEVVMTRGFANNDFEVHFGGEDGAEADEDDAITMIALAIRAVAAATEKPVKEILEDVSFACEFIEDATEIRKDKAKGVNDGVC